jgi:hypothetical protein
MTDNDQNTPEPLPSSVTLLSELLACLYPEPGPDILTLTDFKFRYRLTGLGPLAVGAIQQAQRINRDSGRFNEIGLCEFHVGLIYLDWRDYQGAVQQFREARLQWSFIDKTAAVCLTRLAEGLAQHHRFAYEAALSQYGKAESCQKRIQYEPSSGSRDGFVAQLNGALQVAQQAARDALWEPAPSLPVGESVKEGNGETATSTQSTLSKAEVLSAGVTPSPDSETQEQAAAIESTDVPPPLFPHQLPKEFDIPVPFHQTKNSQLSWYQVHIQRPDPLFSDIKDLGWLLVYQPANEIRYKKGDLIVVANSDPDTKASIILEPLLPRGRVFPRICLARPELELDFTKNDQGEVQFSSEIRQIPVASEHILGYVIGLWLEIGESEILES